MNSRFPLPIRTKFILFFSITSFLFLSVFSVFVYKITVYKSYSFAQQTLEGFLDHESEHLDMPLHQSRSDKEGTHPSGLHLRIKKEGITIYDAFPNFSGGTAKKVLTHSITRNFNGKVYQLQGLFDMSDAEAHFSFLRYILSLSCLLAGIILIPLSTLATNLLLKPFRKLAVETSEISVDKLSFRFVDPKTNDEYGMLARNFNELLSRLNYSFHQVKRFALNASHELRTPLAVIISQGEMALRRERTAEEYRTALSKMIGPAKQLREAVNGLLFLAELDRLKKHDRTIELDIKTIANSLLDIIREAHGQKQIQITLSDPPAQKVVGNREIFQVILANLIENAYKFAKSQIHISFQRTSDDFIILVEDDGPGIPREKHASLLEPLGRPSTPSEDFSPKRGSGLGLSIVRACVDVAKGNIEIDQSKFGGALIRVVLPYS